MFQQSATPQQSDTSLTLARAYLVQFSTLLAVVFVLASYLLIYLARDLDRNEELESSFYAAKAVRSIEHTLGTTLKDYAFWGDAYRYLHMTVDLDWAYGRRNMGPSLFTDFGVQGLFVVNQANQTVYSVINGELVSIEAGEWLHQPLEAILEKARAQAQKETVTTTFVDAGGVPALVAAAALTPGSDSSVDADDKLPSVLIFATLLDDAKLQTMGQDFGVEHMRLADPGKMDSAVTMPLGDLGSAGALQWTPSTPGQRLLHMGLPLIGLAALLVGLMTWAILRRTTAAARALDDGYSALQMSQVALIQSEARFKDVVEASSDWVWEVDLEGRFTYLSERFTEVTGLELGLWIGESIGHLLHGENFRVYDWLYGLHQERNGTVVCSYTGSSGQERVTRLSARAIPDVGFRGTATDVTEEVRAHQHIAYLSQHDALTGLPNRVRLREFLNGKLQMLPSAAKPFALLSLDLDRFKPVNDLLGHSAGDFVLNEVSKRLAACVRHGDLAARIGGDEFVLVVADVRSQAEIESLCQRLIASIERQITVDGHDVFVSASIGIVMAPNDARETSELLRYADIALYEAKASGRNTWRFYAGDMNARIIERRRLENDLRFAIQHGELRLHFQPRYRISDGHMVGAEALVRWQHPDRGLIAPDVFIPIAEETGLILALSDWVLLNACQQAALWPEHLFVSINLSFSEFKRAKLVERVQYALGTARLSPARVELEITETVMLEDADAALEVMHALKRLGVRLAMDDFGTGYSSLGYLRTFPFDGLKIDRSFVSRVLESASDRSVIQSIVSLGRALSLTVTAEGIETADHLEVLKAISCEEGQGYFLSRPLDPDGFNNLLSSSMEKLHDRTHILPDQ